MTLIKSPLSAAVVGAVTSAPLGWLAHRYKVGPFKYETGGQAAVFAAGVGALAALGSYWGIERYMFDHLSSETPEPEPTEVEA